MIAQERSITIAAISGASAVIIGAFGAHGLEARLTQDLMDVYQTGVLYHLVHAVALLAIAFASEQIWISKWAGRIVMAWTLGITLFSGSLYVLAITDVGILGAITPFGGVAFIAGWAMVIPLRKTSRSDS
jgi:uncharacterized membrane protein YgdD (TMEM256/DUF423 family)